MRSRGFHRRLIRFGAALAASAAASALAASAVAAICGSPQELVEAAAVTQRLEIELVDGRLVRLGGLDVPDPGRGDPSTAAEARAFLAARAIGREARLAQLATAPDRWGRLVADVVLAAPGEAETSVADALLGAGFARVRPEFETRACAAQRLAIERAAREAGLGLWRDGYYSVIKASDVDALRRRDGQFVVVEGRVRRVGFGRSRAYLDLGPRGGLAVVAPRKLEAAFERAGRAFGGLTGATIRARGALDGRFGPRIEVAEPAMLEIVRRADAQGGAEPDR